MNMDRTQKLEVYSSDNDDKHFITSAREILFILRTIASHDARVGLYYNNQQRYLLTTLIDVDSQSIYLGCSGDENINAEIMSSDNLVLVSSHHNVKIQFSLSHPQRKNHKDTACFMTPLPVRLFRLQRREYFRLMTPAVNPLKCIIPLDGQVDTQATEITIMDISGGGVALTCEENNTELSPGDRYEGCSINLPGFGIIKGTIAVRNKAVLRDSDGKSYRRAGCEMQDMAPSSAQLLQLYVLHLQRNK